MARAAAVGASCPRTAPDRAWYSDAVTLLSPSELHRPCDPSDVPFETTRDAERVEDIVGQDRAVEAVRFGIAMQREGYNLFALGPRGVGKQTLLRDFLARQAALAPTPDDYCYVASFDDMRRPRALRLPAGRGAPFRAAMERAIGGLRAAMRAAFQSDEHRTRKRDVVNRLKERQQKALAEVQEKAAQSDVAVAQTEDGMILAPLRDGQVVPPDAFHRLPEAEQARLRAGLEKTGEQLNELLGRFQHWVHEHLAELEALDRATAQGVAKRVVDAVRAEHGDLPDVLAHLDRVEADVAAQGGALLDGEEEGMPAALKRALTHGDDGSVLRRYAVNLVIDGDGRSGAPVVREDAPTHANLVGRIEHIQQLGALVTDFSLVRPGALHRARGGYLLLDALEVLRHPNAWDALKRTVRAREIRIESLADALGLVTTQSLEPEAIPLGDTKIVLVGDRHLYYWLASVDPDFLELFKVMVEFEDAMDRGPGAHALYARLIATLLHKEDLRPADRGGVARVIEHAARLAGDGIKLSVRMRPIADLLREADHWASLSGRAVIGAADVETALEAQLRRASRVQERAMESIRRGTLMLDVEGEVVGQINGLTVVMLGEQHFGHPARITARVRLGRGEVVDVEREVELGGPIHSKGVLILVGFLGARYATHVPLALSASIVFEQSYGGVEGDSASLAELCALLSALAEVPIRQSFAVTGSVSQLGRVQPIGGANQKIEGFFDACRERGSTGPHAVILPRTNVEHLMLRRDVVKACEEGRFAVHAVETVDEALELLTGLPAGARGADGAFPEGSVNARVEARLIALAEDARRFAAGATK
jgi:lon-related putative ATP-dependent protease